VETAGRKLDLITGTTLQTALAARESLDGRRKGVRAFLPLAGPAIMASVAYMDPGNFATNLQAGSTYGYRLLWVVLAASLVAMLFQAMSAKLGIVTGRNLAEVCREQFSRPVVIGMWIASELAAMATDIAEFIGGALGISLLFHLSLLCGLGITAVVTLAILRLDTRGFPRSSWRSPRWSPSSAWASCANWCWRRRTGAPRCFTPWSRNCPIAGPSCWRSGSSAPPSCPTRSTCIRA
jgi:hypothetical protein